ncbi:hypothetical protein GCM10007962_10170 [Yeosuana aromativorans]|uniref:Peptidase M56 domain-containing protein n=1 Tax=Yeosuana aromativorans TaxID=288019 RepID=A0A8J3BIU8_9FLAO|nr:M56 family metallopeptidase [Yeosuana aromativorans]GGK17914.1 hypothetical protein GCM10007962_10170 [Yeosuana aromativorans]
MEYLLKASAIIALFYVCYKVFLQDETFFESNRWFLLFGLLMAICMPFVVIPIYVEQAPLLLDNYTFTNASEPIQQTKKTFDILAILTLVYGLGVLAFAIRFIVQLTSLGLLLFKSKKVVAGKFTLIKTNKNIPPFSFFSYIVYNPNQFSESELEQILTHEKVHVTQRHSADILLSQLSCIVFWFNPFVWLYNKALKQNLEFIADKTAVKLSSCKKSYQYTLLKTSMPTHQLALTNNFYNSLIKKRIVMLHKSKSKKINLFKYSLILPLLALFLMSFNTEEVIIEKALKEPTEQPVLNPSSNVVIPALTKTQVEKPALQNATVKKTNSTSANIEVIITKDFTDNDFEKLKTKFKNEGYTLKVKGVKRNKQGEITSIKIEVSSQSSNANYNIDTNEAINPIKISIDDDGKNISIGNGHSTKEKHMVFISKDGNKHVINGSDDDSNVFVISDTDGDVEFDNDVDVKTFVVKKGDSIKVRKIHKKMNSDDDVFFITKDDNAKVHKVIKIKTDDDHSGISWTTDDDEKVIINGDSDAKVKILSTEGKEPLYILDGKEITSQEMKDIDPKNIEKVEVLKGDGATEKYGDKGKNGVVMITTKK